MPVDWHTRRASCSVSAVDDASPASRPVSGTPAPEPATRQIATLRLPQQCHVDSTEVALPTRRPDFGGKLDVECTLLLVDMNRFAVY